MHHPKISLCILAKNEGHCIARCLASVRDLVDEIIVVDTGSSDDTPTVARQFNALVLHHAWQNDFSFHRNYGISHASHDWILVLDCDEVIDTSHHELVRSAIHDPACCYLLTQRHYTEDYRLSAFTPAHGQFPHWEQGFPGYFESSLVRLFPRVAGIHYSGVIHELVEPSIEALGVHRVVPSGIVIHHYGHVEGSHAKKGGLYRRLGRDKIRSGAGWKAYFEMGIELNAAGRLRESVDAFVRATILEPRYPAAWVNLGYVLCELSRYRDAAAALECALSLDPRNAEAWCNLGVVALRQGDYGRAGTHFERALVLDNGYVNAMCNLGKALASQGRGSDAAAVYRRALHLMPTCSEAKVDLGTLYLCAGKTVEARPLLLDALRDPRTRARAEQALALLQKEV